MFVHTPRKEITLALSISVIWELMILEWKDLYKHYIMDTYIINKYGHLYY